MPYKKAWTLDQAVTYLVENSGSHFDPDVVEAFICILPQILGIREQFGDEAMNNSVMLESAAPLTQPPLH